jgi:hypothetical protein
MYAFIALGYTMVYGIIKLINFAHSEFFMVGAFLGFLSLHYLPAERLPLPGSLPVYAGLLVAVLVAAFGTAIFAVLCEKLLYKPLRGEGRIAAMLAAIYGLVFALFFWTPVSAISVMLALALLVGGCWLILTYLPKVHGSVQPSAITRRPHRGAVDRAWPVARASERRGLDLHGDAARLARGEEIPHLARNRVAFRDASGRPRGRSSACRLSCSGSERDPARRGGGTGPEHRLGDSRRKYCGGCRPALAPPAPTAAPAKLEANIFHFDGTNRPIDFFKGQSIGPGQQAKLDKLKRNMTGSTRRTRSRRTPRRSWFSSP